jgi:hypothetical protein
MQTDDSKQKMKIILKEEIFFPQSFSDIVAHQ